MDTYSPVVIWVSVRDMLPLSNLIELQTKSVDIFLAYIKADVISELFMEIPICLGLKWPTPENGSSD